MNKDTHTLAHGPRSLPFGRGSPLMRAEQMLGRAEMSRVEVPSRTETGKALSQPLSLSLSFLGPLHPPRVSQSHTFCEIVLLFVFEEIDLYVCKENPRAFSS